MKIISDIKRIRRILRSRLTTTLLFVTIISSLLFTGAQLNSGSAGDQTVVENPYSPLSITTQVNIDSLIQHLVNSGQTTYMWNIEQDSAWSDLHVLLPLAKAEGIQIYVSLLPPSLSPPICGSCNYSEPFRLDFITWANQIATLSRSYSNLRGYTIKNLPENLSAGYLTQAYIDEVIATGQAINPNLQFLPSGRLGNIFYVDRDAKGNGDGTSWANASQLSSFNWSLAQAGDTVYINGGSDSLDYGNSYIWPGGWNGLFSGTAQNNIVITRGKDSGHNGVPIINGDDSNPPILISSNQPRQFIEISYLDIRGIKPANGNGGGTVFIRSNGPPVSDIYLIHNKISTAVSNAIYVKNVNNFNILYNDIELPGVANSDEGDGIHIEGDANVNYSNCEIAYNRIVSRRATLNGTSDPHLDIIQTNNWQVNGTGLSKLHNNIFVQYPINSGPSGSCVNLEGGGGYWKIYNNIFVYKNLTNGNILVFNAKNYSGSTKAPLYGQINNNTFFLSSSWLTQCPSFYGVDSLEFKNNIIAKPYASGGSAYCIMMDGFTESSGYIDIDYNQYYTNDANFFVYRNIQPYSQKRGWNEWQTTAIGVNNQVPDANGEFGIVEFVDTTGNNISDFKLVNGSSGIDEGIDLSEYFTTDIINTPRPQNFVWDRGALEQ